MNTRVFPRCRLLTLVGVDRSNRAITRRVLTPFDTPEPVAYRSAPSYVSRRVWLGACRALVAGDTPPGSLRCGPLARMDLYPHQLEPALAILRGLGSRVLLADDVGLGKTLQAGLIVAELLAIGGGDRALIITPAGLRDQWQRELSSRVGVEATVIDAHRARRAKETLPLELSPWDVSPVAIASADYIKRAEVLADLSACRWDVVVVDEAHGVAGDSDRRAAVAAIAAKARYVVLLTATPHSGDRQQFESLCNVGRAAGDTLLVFRRSRQEVGISSRRRVHCLDVRSSPEERRMHACLRDFSRAVRQSHRERGSSVGADVMLALSVLQKRALSSARALERSVARRLTGLSDKPREVGQLVLPLDDLTGEQSSADEPPEWPAQLSLRNSIDERRLLGALAAAADAAAARETKVGAIRRLIRRIGQPLIVFTEYRDTLVHLEASLGLPCAIVHGGLGRRERHTAVERFTTGAVQLLLATDAAGEGLNLHHTCRAVINLELPWNPMRLEQRVGRVDRIGQHRTVHVFHLLAREAGESFVVHRLESRIAKALADVGGSSPLGGARETTHEPERPDLGVADAEGTQRQNPSAAQSVVDGRAQSPVLVQEATAEAARICEQRRYVRAGDEGMLARALRGTSLAAARRSTTRQTLRRRLLTIWRLGAEDGAGRFVAARIVPVLIELPTDVPSPPAREALGRLLRERHEILMARIDESAEAWRHEVRRVRTTWLQARRSRESAIHAARGIPASPLRQSGLFDRRADRAALAVVSAERARLRAHADQTLELRGSGDIVFEEPQLLLVMSG